MIQENANTINLNITLQSNPIPLLENNLNIKFTKKCILRLNLEKQIAITDLMKHLTQLYQKLVNYNHILQYQIYPAPLALVTGEKYNKTCLGGTFDHLHIGHLLLLTLGVLLTQKELTVGITSPPMLLKKKYHEMIQCYHFRQKQVKRFLQTLNPNIGYRIAKLVESFGPPLVQADYQTIIVSPQTYQSAQQINKLRQEKKFPQLKIYTIQYIQPANNQQKDTKISSTNIRKYFFEKNRFQQQGSKQKYQNIWTHLHTKLGKQFSQNNEEKINDLSEIQFEELFNSYSEHWRHFHTNQHIFQMSTQYFVLPTLHCKQQELAVCFSIFYHDIVYDPRSKTNEQDSVEVWKRYITKLRPYLQKPIQQLISNVNCLILSTKRHHPVNALQERLTDLDMGILDSEPQKYKQYSEDIQKQYSPLFQNPLEYLKKREEFLSGLELGKIFTHRKIKHLKDNISSELQRISNKLKQGNNHK